MGNLAKFAVPAVLVAVAWKFGKLAPKDILAVAAVSIAAGMVAPSLPVIGK